MSGGMTNQNGAMVEIGALSVMDNLFSTILQENNRNSP